MKEKLLSLIRQRDKQIASLKHEINNLMNELKIKSNVPNKCARLHTLTNLSSKIASKISFTSINQKNYFPNTQLLTNIFTNYYKFFNIKFVNFPIK